MSTGKIELALRARFHRFGPVADDFRVAAVRIQHGERQCDIDRIVFGEQHARLTAIANRHGRAASGDCRCLVCNPGCLHDCPQQVGAPHGLAEADIDPGCASDSVVLCK